MRDIGAEMLDLLIEAPDGLTIYEMADRLQISRDRAKNAVRKLRMVFADQEIWLTCDPQGLREPWLYRLVGGKVMVDATETGWFDNRIRDTETRVRTEVASMSSAEVNTSPDTVEGRKARVLKRGLSRMVEDLDEIEWRFNS